MTAVLKVIGGANFYTSRTSGIADLIEAVFSADGVLNGPLAFGINGTAERAMHPVASDRAAPGLITMSDDDFLI